MPADGGKVGATVEGFKVGGQEDGHWPATLSGQRHDCCHVDAVQVGAFLAVDLDADEACLQDGGYFRVFKRFVRHDMAPVTGSITDAQENGLVFTTGFLQGFRTPGIPVDRVVGVLDEIGGVLVCEMIGHIRSRVCSILN